MLRIITGKPGAGKSYYVVHQITDRHCDYDHIADQFILKPGVHLAASLDGLRVDHVDLDRLIDQHGLEAVINVDFWQPISERYPQIVIIIDEAQRYFPSAARNIPNSVWYFFEYHRHLGLDLYLLTQHPSSLHRRILNVAEHYIEAAPPALRGLGNVFRYRNVDVTTGEVISRSTLKADKRVFRAYQSATHAQGLKPPKNVMLKYLAYAGVAFAVIPLGVLWFGHKFKTHAPGPIPTAQASTASHAHHHHAQARPAAAPAPTIQTDYHGPVTRDDLMRWSVTGIPVEDLPRIPPGCNVQGYYVHCPPYTLPRDIQLSVASYVCDAKRERCHVYIPIAAEAPRPEGQGMDAI